MRQLLSDISWALSLVAARRHRRSLMFSGRATFDRALQPPLHRVTRVSGGDGADPRAYQLPQEFIAYPDALYRAGPDDVDRAIRATLKASSQ